jgi:hypothetical protein
MKKISKTNFVFLSILIVYFIFLIKDFVKHCNYLIFNFSSFFIFHFCIISSLIISWLITKFIILFHRKNKNNLLKISLLVVYFISMIIYIIYMFVLFFTIFFL